MNYYLIENIYNISSLPLITFMKYWQTDNSRVLELAKSALPPLIHVSILKQMSLLYGKCFSGEKCVHLFFQFRYLFQKSKELFLKFLFLHTLICYFYR